jgi:hypothetical protein
MFISSYISIENCACFKKKCISSLWERIFINTTVNTNFINHLNELLFRIVQLILYNTLLFNLIELLFRIMVFQLNNKNIVQDKLHN